MDSVEGQPGLSMAEPLPQRWARRVVPQTGRRASKSDVFMESQPGVLEAQPPDDEPELCVEHHASATQHVQSAECARDDRFAIELSAADRRVPARHRRLAEAVSRTR